MEESKSRHQPFPESQKEIDLVNDDGFVVDKLKIDENDPIFAETFRQMITDHFAEGKHFFVAKILSKNVDWKAATVQEIPSALNSSSTQNQVVPETSNRKDSKSEAAAKKKEADKEKAAEKDGDGKDKNVNFSHFFNAYGILKLLFKKRENEFVGRFHERFPITAKNPITNCVSSD